MALGWTPSIQKRKIKLTGKVSIFYLVIQTLVLWVRRAVEVVKSTLINALSYGAGLMGTDLIKTRPYSPKP